AGPLTIRLMIDGEVEHIVVWRNHACPQNGALVGLWLADDEAERPRGRGGIDGRQRAKIAPEARQALPRRPSFRRGFGNLDPAALERVQSLANRFANVLVIVILQGNQPCCITVFDELWNRGQ